MNKELLSRKLGTLLRQGLDHQLYSGAQCVVRQKNESVEMCCGMTRMQSKKLDNSCPCLPVSHDTLFDVASLTKPIVTASLVMHAVDNGDLRVDQKLVSLLNYPLPGWVMGATVAELLTHTSPLPAWYDFHGRYVTLQSREMAIRRILREYFNLNPRDDADTRACYSDLGYILLGLVLERLYGNRLDHIFRRLISDPLGLSDSMMFCPLEHADRDRCAATKLLFGFPLFGHPDDDNCRSLLHVAGHAGLFATARAIADFAESLFDGRFPSRKNTINAFLTASRPNTCFAFGWDRPSSNTSLSARKPGEPVIGHLGYTGCSVWIDLTNHRSVTLLTNRQTANSQPDSISALRREVCNAAWNA